MTLEPEAPDAESYELIDAEAEAAEPIDFEQWLRVGFESFVFEGRGAWAFPQAAGKIALRDDDAVQGLCDFSDGLSAADQSRFRCALADLLASLPSEDRYVQVFEHLLDLAAALPAPETLRAIVQRVGEGFFGARDGERHRRLFASTLLGVARLSGPRDDAEACLLRLIGSKNFIPEFAGVALVALCRARAERLPEHLDLLRGSLMEMFDQSTDRNEAQRRLAEQVLDAVGLRSLVTALARLKYFTPGGQFDPDGLDCWLLRAFVAGQSAPLRCFKLGDDTLHFERRSERGKPGASLGVADSPAFRDFFDVLRRYIYVEQDVADSDALLETMSSDETKSSDTPSQLRQLLYTQAPPPASQLC